ncbi:tetratricopeptide repeat protein [Mucilaginibacter pedocola]|uniref:Uncharacterized protein n=1 Tax=Mucilaginibacter pedocola TaxID=1792845 RepID=A0A1S9PMD3_9SPHI|nr:hypothetical protein [Mucilaginibacter pedocola]OOQ62113.1 hypothetical protein BC343_03425 [Mucilaginibacter pedocola]
MKIKFLMAGLLALTSATTFAQKKELSTAKSEYEKYAAIRQGPLAVTGLANAKIAIDKAAADAKTSVLAETFVYKGFIYGGLAVTDTTQASAQAFATASEALTKAKELDTKGEFKKQIEEAGLTLAQYQMNAGVKAYQAGKYDVAYKAFSNYNAIIPGDTTGLLNAGISAYNSKNYPAAIETYNKLVATKYSGAEAAYDDLSGMYLMNKDTVGALKSIGEGLAKYPNNNGLRRKEIEIALQTGKSDEVLSKITAAIEKDSKNKTLYYYAGLVYSQTADALTAKMAKTKAAPAKATLKTQRDENLAKAKDMYKKGLEIDPNYFEANMNMGYVLLAPATEAYNSVRNLPANATQKQYNEALAKSDALFDAAKPYLVKAAELKPTSRTALENLKTYYIAKRDQPNVDKYTKLLASAKED